MRGFRKITGAWIFLLSLTGPALAHHSFAMFDRDKKVVLTGTVKEFQYTNPHSWIQMLVKTPDGRITEWGIEMQAISILSHLGWTHSTLKPGDVVTVTASPRKDGQPQASFLSIKLPNGKIIQYAPQGGGDR
jgi:hypothetical protein